MYLASKYEDIYPLHSKIVYEKIAHKAITSKEILAKESNFLRTFDFEIDFLTHYDFHQTYCDLIKF
jgi:cyclin-A